MDFYKHNSFDLVTTIDGRPAMQCKCKKTFLIASRNPRDVIAAHKKHAPNLNVPEMQKVGRR